MAFHGNSGADDSLRSYPGTVFKDDGLNDEVKGRFLVVVVAGEEHGSLGEATIGAYLYCGEVIDPNIFSYPGVVSDLEEPRVFDVYRWVDADTFANPGSKKTQQEHLQSAGGIPGVFEEENIQVVPHESFDRVPGIKPGVIIM